MTTINWKQKLTSRKLWVALAGFIVGLLMELGVIPIDQAETIRGLVLMAGSVVGYLIGEGLADIKVTKNMTDGIDGEVKKSDEVHHYHSTLSVDK